MTRAGYWRLPLIAGVAFLLVYLSTDVDLPSAASPPCTDDPTAQQIREMTVEAVKGGYQDHVRKLFETWMREETADQALRVQRGMDKAIRVYLTARGAAEKWRPKC